MLINFAIFARWLSMLFTSVAQTFTKAVTFTGGIVATTKRRLSNITIGGVAYGSLGTAVSHVNGTIYIAELSLEVNKTITGIAVLNAGIVGTNKVVVALYDSAGNKLATSALAGTLSAGANAFQEVALTTPYAAVGPARYFIAAQYDGATDNFRCIAASTYLIDGSATAGVFGTLPATLTVPTTFTADVAPIGYVYT